MMPEDLCQEALREKKYRAIQTDLNRCKIWGRGRLKKRKKGKGKSLEKSWGYHLL